MLPLNKDLQKSVAIEPSEESLNGSSSSNVRKVKNVADECYVRAHG